MADIPSTAVQIGGQEYRVRGEQDGDALERAAGAVNRTMTRIREHTGTVDSLDVAVLTALNLARELIATRSASPTATPSAQASEPPPASVEAADSGRLRELIELAEAALERS